MVSKIEAVSGLSARIRSASDAMKASRHFAPIWIESIIGDSNFRVKQFARLLLRNLCAVAHYVAKMAGLEERRH